MFDPILRYLQFQASRFSAHGQSLQQKTFGIIVPRGWSRQQHQAKEDPSASTSLSWNPKNQATKCTWKIFWIPWSRSWHSQNNTIEVDNYICHLRCARNLRSSWVLVDFRARAAGCNASFLSPPNLSIQCPLHRMVQIGLAGLWLWGCVFDKLTSGAWKVMMMKIPMPMRLYKAYPSEWIWNESLHTLKHPKPCSRTWLGFLATAICR